MTKTNTVAVPYKLSFVPGTGGPGKGADMRPGRGEAGWTVVDVPAASLASFLRDLPREAWMPGTHRVAASQAAQ